MVTHHIPKVLARREAFHWSGALCVRPAMPRDPFIREEFTKERSAARKLVREYLERYPKDQYQTEVESWRNLQSANIEFTMKRLREPIED